jgi:repressor LexA
MTRLDEHGERIIAFVESYHQAHHCSPSYEEIGEAVGLTSKDHVSRDLRKLKHEGYISFTPGMSRSIVLMKNGPIRSHPGRGKIHPPVVGAIVGDKQEPGSNWDRQPFDWISIARELVDDNQDLRVLRVHGSSLLDALVNDGDLVVIKPKQTAQDGEMIAAWLKPQQTMTLKYYHRENGHVRLEPVNPALPPLQVKSSDIEIRGQVVAIVRKTR